ncbi:Hypothetical_protein [Hexamita inflata]|uniref:Hypothetical_protein n=1 Tax=Hexamita inflata TaxID=28002 RepID=A0AA86TMA5_9EUKA|nr:Hypothetical protein HINF_LOCUS10529 [Hexamita inflata]
MQNLRQHYERERKHLELHHDIANFQKMLQHETYVTFTDIISSRLLPKTIENIIRIKYSQYSWEQFIENTEMMLSMQLTRSDSKNILTFYGILAKSRIRNYGQIRTFLYGKTRKFRIIRRKCMSNTRTYYCNSGRSLLYGFRG